MTAVPDDTVCNPLRRIVSIYLSIYLYFWSHFSAFHLGLRERGRTEDSGFTTRHAADLLRGRAVLGNDDQVSVGAVGLNIKRI